MAAERYSTEQVLAFLDTEELDEEDFLGEEVDGQEVFMEGSDEEFDDLEEMETVEGKFFFFLFFFFFSLICVYTEENCMDFEEQSQPPENPLIHALLSEDTDFFPPSSPVVEGAHEMDSDREAESPSLEASTAEPVWTETLSVPSLHSFSDSSPLGPTVPIPAMPKKIFQLFFTPELVASIRDETNKYAREVIPPEKLLKWMDVGVEDIYAYLGFNILMGLNPKPSINDYWRKDPLYHYSPISDRISRDRYLEIHRHLHFVSNSTLAPRSDPNYDRLGKARPLLNYLSERFKSVYNPSKELAVDEAMIKFQGRSSLKQYMPKKPTRRGIKVWVLGDSSNGYFCRLDVYTGKKKKTEHGLGTGVVKELTKDFHHTWRYIFFDNFFTSHGLLDDLYQSGLYGCGTARSNRKGFPSILKKIKLKNR